MTPAELSGHTPGHVDCPLCEPARLRIIAPAEFGLLRFRDAARVWLGERRPELAEGSIRNYQNHFRWLNEFFGELVLHEVHIGHVHEYQKWRQQPRYDERAHRTFRAGYSPINHELSALQQILARAGLWTEIAKFYKPLRQPKTRIGRALEEEEQERLFVVASSNKRWKVAYLCALITANTTAGANEIRHLRIGDIDLRSQVPTVRIQEGTKNKFRERTIALNPTAVMALNTLLERAYQHGAAQPEHYLLPRRAHRRGEDADPNRPMSSWKGAWRSLRAAADLPRLRYHDLRHHVITKLLENPEVSEQTVLEIAGHITKKMQNHYSHIRAKRKLEALSAAETKAPAMQLGLGFGAMEMPRKAPAATPGRTRKAERS